MLKVCVTTGYGGGYNERGIVEYKEKQEESDDEYDEVCLQYT